MLTGKQFVDKIESENEALFQACELQTKDFYDKNKDRSELIDNFVGRMVNERMNMVEISKEVAAMPEDTDPEKLVLLSKQALDEAKHFRMVRDVVEYLTKGKIDIKAAVESHKDKIHQKGASLIAKYNCNNDKLMLAVYQCLAEGRAARNWGMMAKCITDKFVSETYAEIAKDESFHAEIGRMELEKLCDSQEAQDRVNSVIGNFREDLYAITSAKTGELPEARKIMDEAYA